VSYNNEVDLILEKLNSIKFTKREFYPRNFELSDRFIKEFQREVVRLRGSGMSKKQTLQKICKALRFHV